MVRILRLYLAGFLVFCGLAATEVSAYPYKSHPVSSEFRTPPKLRGRVDFWKDVFTKYDKEHIVIHHREYPQVVFNVIDLTSESIGISKAEFLRFRKGVEKKAVEEVRTAIKYLATDAQPETRLQKTISAKMQFLGRGTAKYKRIIKDDLIRTQTGIRERFADSIRRSGRYLPIIEKIFVEEFGLPVELTRLPFIESSFDYTAYSSVGAAGIWQFMPRTAKIYMTVNKYVDERRDPIEASRGAAKYLRDAYRRLGNWPLAITSYNHGVGGVASKVAKIGTSDIVRLIDHPEAFGFASSNFYPEFLAALEVYNNYEDHFPGLQREPPIKAREVVIGRPVSAPYMAKQLGVGIEALKVVNYALSQSVWQGKYLIPAGYRLKVPHHEDLHLAYARASAQEVRPIVSAPPSSSIYGGVNYKVRRGDTLIGIAQKYHATVEDIKALNNLKSNSIRVGQTLKVKAAENEEMPVRSAPKPAPKVAKTKFETYKVRKGDTLWALSIKFGVPIQAIKDANRDSIVGNKLTGGKSIRIPVK